MKKKDLKDLHSKTIKELQGLIQKTESDLVKQQIDLRAGKLKNFALVKKTKSDLARFKTILKEKELNEAA